MKDSTKKILNIQEESRVINSVWFLVSGEVDSNIVEIGFIEEEEKHLCWTGEKIKCMHIYRERWGNLLVFLFLWYRSSSENKESVEERFVKNGECVIKLVSENVKEWWFEESNRIPSRIKAISCWWLWIYIAVNLICSKKDVASQVLTERNR